MESSVYNKMTFCEKEVATVLEELGIQWRFEHPIFVWDEQGRPRVWVSDFYLVQFDIYVEVCGYGTFDNTYRRKVFSENGYQVIFLHLYKTSCRWKKYLIRTKGTYLICA